MRCQGYFLKIALGTTLVYYLPFCDVNVELLQNLNRGTLYNIFGVKPKLLYTVFFIRIKKFLARLGDSASNDSQQILNLISKLGYIGIHEYEV